MLLTSCNIQNETTIRRMELLFSCRHSRAIPLIRLFPKNPTVGRIFGLSIDGQLCPSLFHTTLWTFMFCPCFIMVHGQSHRAWRNFAISVIGISGKMVLFAWRPWHLFVIGESWPKKKQFFDETPVEELIADQRLISIYFVSTSRKTFMNNRIFSEQPETILNIDDTNFNKKWKTT